MQVHHPLRSSDDKLVFGSDLQEYFAQIAQCLDNDITLYEGRVFVLREQVEYPLLLSMSKMKLS